MKMFINTIRMIVQKIKPVIITLLIILTLFFIAKFIIDDRNDYNFEEDALLYESLFLIYSSMAEDYKYMSDFCTSAAEISIIKTSELRSDLMNSSTHYHKQYKSYSTKSFEYKERAEKLHKKAEFWKKLSKYVNFK